MKYKHIKLSNHARKRMRNRNIPRRQVVLTLNEPERIGPGKEEGVLIAERSTEAGNVIQVVYFEDPSEHPGYDAFIIILVRR